MVMHLHLDVIDLRYYIKMHNHSKQDFVTAPCYTSNMFAIAGYGISIKQKDNAIDI